MTDICRRNNVYPINHLKYKEKHFEGDFTYLRNGKKSQIDLVLTNNHGRGDVTLFKILKTNWHVSDHRPIQLKIQMEILIRAENLNYKYSPEDKKVSRYNKCFNTEFIEDYIIQNKDTSNREITSTLQEHKINIDIDKINKFVGNMHRCAQTKKNRPITPNNCEDMNIANEKFKIYCNCLPNGNLIDISKSLDEYKLASKIVNKTILENESKKWYKLINNKDSKELWKCVDWKGGFNNRKIETHPNISDLKAHFQNIYSTEDQLEKSKIEELTTEVYIPTLDDPIDGREINEP